MSIWDDIKTFAFAAFCVLAAVATTVIAMVGIALLYAAIILFTVAPFVIVGVVLWKALT